MSKIVYKDKINYSQVKVYKHWWMIKNSAMAHDGNIHFNPSDFRSDFSREKRDIQALFIHEMAHVWQKQQGKNVLLRGVGHQIKGVVKSSYIWTPNPTYDEAIRDPSRAKPGQGHKKIEDYNMEQQGDIFASYFLVKYHGETRGRGVTEEVDLYDFEHPTRGILRDFIN